MMTLAETQARFHAFATRSLLATQHDPAETFVGTPALPASDRLAIYANMYLWRQADALREDFPKLAAALGDEGFYAFVEGYVREHPSEHPSLSKLGRRVADYLAAHPAGRADLRDLARLEWARAEAFEAEDVPLAAIDWLGGISVRELPGLKLAFAPAVRLLRLDHDAAALWSAIEDGAVPLPPRCAEVSVAVWRREFEVYHALLDADEARAVERVMMGYPLGAVCEPFAGREDAADAALRAVASWFVEGWVRR
jgi:hypothetical protein